MTTNGTPGPGSPIAFAAQHFTLVVAQQLHSMVGLGMLPQGTQVTTTVQEDGRALQLQVTLPSPILQAHRGP